MRTDHGKNSPGETFTGWRETRRRSGVTREINVDAAKYLQVISLIGEQYRHNPELAFPCQPAAWVPHSAPWLLSPRFRSQPQQGRDFGLMGISNITFVPYLNIRKCSGRFHAFFLRRRGILKDKKNKSYQKYTCKKFKMRLMFVS